MAIAEYVEWDGWSELGSLQQRTLGVVLDYVKGEGKEKVWDTIMAGDELPEKILPSQLGSLHGAAQNNAVIHRERCARLIETDLSKPISDLRKEAFQTLNESDLAEYNVSMLKVYQAAIEHVLDQILDCVLERAAEAVSLDPEQLVEELESLPGPEEDGEEASDLDALAKELFSEENQPYSYARVILAAVEWANEQPVPVADSDQQIDYQHLLTLLPMYLESVGDAAIKFSKEVCAWGKEKGLPDSHIYAFATNAGVEFYRVAATSLRIA